MTDPTRRPTRRAQALRTNATTPERLLWKHLRNRQLLDCKFSRQMPVGPYICDFLCRERGLVIELDGGQHASDIGYDERRTAFLGAQGLTVLRFWNNDVYEHLPHTLERIEQVIAGLPVRFETAGAPHPQPLPQAGGEF